jgi:hypothetical protein
MTTIEPTIESLAIDKPLDPEKRYGVKVSLCVQEIGSSSEEAFFDASLTWHSCGLDVVNLIQTKLIAAQASLNEVGAARLANAAETGGAKLKT